MVANGLFVTRAFTNNLSSMAAGPLLATSEEIRTAKSKNAITIDLRTPPEIEETPSPRGSLVWDFRADATVPVASLPHDKSTPIVLF